VRTPSYPQDRNKLSNITQDAIPSTPYVPRDTGVNILHGFSKMLAPVEWPLTQINGGGDQSDLYTRKRGIMMKTLGMVLAVALIGSFIASASAMAREPGYQRHRTNTKRVLVNPAHPIYRYGNITGAP
jgi:hypothetical protein